MRTTHMSRCQLTLGLLLLGTLGISSALDVSTALAQFPQFSKFNELLNTTNVLQEVNSRFSITILLPEDGILNAYLGSHPSYTTQMVADVLRYHVLLSYFGGEELPTLNGEVQNGGIVTTLFQTTGRSNGLDGFVNITAQRDGSVTVGPSTPGSPIQANIITNVSADPYVVSYLQISAVLEPLGLAAAQLAPTSPPSVSPSPAPMGPAAPKPSFSAPPTLPATAPTPIPDLPAVPAPAPTATTPSEPAPASEPVPASESAPSPGSQPAVSVSGPSQAPFGAPIAGSASISVGFSFGLFVASAFVAAALLMF